MPRYNYKAKKSPQEIASGSLDAETIDDAVNKIIQLGFAPIDVTAGETQPVSLSKTKKTFSFDLSSRIKTGELAVFTRQLSDLINANVPLVRALEIASRQTKNQTLKRIIPEMIGFVQDGGALSSAAAQHPKVFSQLFVHMVRSGEISGQLNIILSRLADFIEKEQDVRSKITSSLIYPSLMLLVGAGTIFILLSFVIPRLTVMFDDLTESLPLATLLLINLSSFFARFWWLLLGLVFLGSVVFKNYLNTLEGRLWFDGLKLRIPLLGNFIRDAEIGRFSRTLATLLDSGVVIVTALDSAWSILDNTLLRQEVRLIAQQVAGGTSLSSALQKSQYFPEAAVNMLSVGEESGHLEVSLYKLAESYEKQTDRAMRTFTTLLEPLLIMAIGLIVGFIVIALLLPIFKMNLIIQ